MPPHNAIFDQPFSLQVEVCRQLLASGLQNRAEIIAWAERQGHPLTEAHVRAIAQKLSIALKDERKADPAILPAYRIALERLRKEV